MRVAVTLLACLGGAALSPGFADPPSDAAAPTPTTESAAPAAAPVGTPAPAATPATPAATQARAAAPTPQAAPRVDQDEKLLLAAGFKPEVRNGTTVWCRRVEEIGSRVSAKKLCGTAEELAVSVRETRQRLEISQRQQLNPVNH
ncbi:MAG TPA: hypothetical protein VFK87_12730 [Steroidobacteraceae bacterium]|nr:hypothetical protein [Steroidobacteraceae bacterium]